MITADCSFLMLHQLQSCRPKVSGLRIPGPRYVGERVAVTGAQALAAVPARLLLPSCGQSVIGSGRSTSSSDWQILNVNVMLFREK